ncbi:hypothetical protein HK405_010418 [Cladochytrium tenue]|nr:hypothetical protein HK405_010418 [Cladochytrium tenue]
MSLIANGLGRGGAERRVALVLGASRGIGAEVARALAAVGWHVVVTAKSTSSSSGAAAPAGLEGTVESVRDDIVRAGGSASCIPVDVRKPDDIAAAVEAACSLGRLEAVVYNAGAVWWGSVETTDLKRFDLMQEVNMRGWYATVTKVLPVYRKQGSGRLLAVSPPIYSRFFRGKTAYAVGKVGMTVLAMGLAMDLDGSNIAVSCLWPAYAVESAVTQKYKISPANLVKASIFADAVVGILEDSPAKVNGVAFLDEDYLRDMKGVTDFSQYWLGKLPWDRSASIYDTGSDGSQGPPKRMLPKKLPSLLVEEQDDRGMSINSAKARL